MALPNASWGFVGPPEAEASASAAARCGYWPADTIPVR
jgi:hypothetical protein